MDSISISLSRSMLNFPIIRYQEKNMRRTVVFILIALLSCATAQNPQKTSETAKETSADIEPMRKFFDVFEKDMVNTAHVIAQQELVKTLTHLQKMNFGGNRYYPLEREALTKMIRELSSYDYAECILLNKSGTVIYTMKEDRIFAKNAASFTESLSVLFKNGKEGPFLLDTNEFPVLSKQYVIFFAIPVPDADDGVLLAAIHTDAIARLNGIKGSFVDQNGLIRLSSDPAKLMTASTGFRGKNTGKAFRYHNLEWFTSPD